MAKAKRMTASERMVSAQCIELKNKLATAEKLATLRLGKVTELEAKTLKLAAEASVEQTRMKKDNDLLADELVRLHAELTSVLESQPHLELERMKEGMKWWNAFAGPGSGAETIKKMSCEYIEQRERLEALEKENAELRAASMAFNTTKMAFDRQKQQQLEDAEAEVKRQESVILACRADSGLLRTQLSGLIEEKKRLEAECDRKFAKLSMLETFIRDYTDKFVKDNPETTRTKQLKVGAMVKIKPYGTAQVTEINYELNQFQCQFGSGQSNWFPFGTGVIIDDGSETPW